MKPLTNSKTGVKQVVQNLLGILTLGACLMPCSHAELTTYTSRAAFEAAVSEPLFEEDFEGFVSDANLHGETVTTMNGAVELSATTNYKNDLKTALMRIDAPPYNQLFGGGGIDSIAMSGTFVFGNINSSFNGTLTMGFPPREECFHSVGFDYSGAAGYLNGAAAITSYRVTTLDGNVTTAAFTIDDGFLGFTSPDSPITSIILVDSTNRSDNGIPGPGEGLAFDNLVVSLTDTDGDGMHDFFEEQYGLAVDADDASSDPDLDGLDSLAEFILHTDPRRADSDGDGLHDGIESGSGIYVGADDTGTSPLMADTDRDGLWDSQEIPTRNGSSFILPATDPNRNDSDADGVEDGFEISQRSAPNESGASPSSLASGLVSHWAFDGHLLDLVGDNDGGNFNIQIPFVEGKFGEAGDFDETYTVLTVSSGEESEFDFQGGNMSVSIWFRFDSAGGGAWQTLIAKGNDSNGGWRLRRSGSSNRLTFATAAGDTTDTGPDVNDSLWHHAVAVAEAGVGTRLYIDGVLAASGPAPILNDTDLRLMIGAEPSDNGFGRKSKTDIDDVAVWSRALSEEEIASMWNDGTGDSIADLLAAESPLQIDRFRNHSESGKPSLTWISRPGKMYIVESSTDLQNWVELEDSLASQGLITNYIDEGVPMPRPPQRYFRLMEEN